MTIENHGTDIESPQRFNSSNFLGPNLTKKFTHKETTKGEGEVHIPGSSSPKNTPELRSRPIPETKARECPQYMWHRGILGISSQEVANIYVTYLLAVTVLLYVL